MVAQPPTWRDYLVRVVDEPVKPEPVAESPAEPAPIVEAQPEEPGYMQRLNERKQVMLKTMCEYDPGEFWLKQDLGEEKAKKIYQFVQDKTRYISVQVGIGGWKPFNTSEVDKLGYGDCKALTNYTMSLLKAAGVTSNYCVVYGGDDIMSLEEDLYLGSLRLLEVDSRVVLPIKVHIRILIRVVIYATII